MFAEIGRIVNEDISPRVGQFDVLFEAITNAIQANATRIECEFNSSDNPIKSNGIELASKKVESILVRDNGDGFTDSNFDSFCRYRSEHKKHLGGKGVGRFVFLKVYDSAQFRSVLKKEKLERNFTFDLNFDTSNINSTDAAFAIDSNKTEVILQNLSLDYYNSEINLDRRIELNIEVICERVLFSLTPTLFFYQKKGTEIEIIFVDKTTSQRASITPKDIPNFTQKKFQAQDSYSRHHDFLLSYSINEVVGSLNAFYCANYRTVCDFSDKDFRLQLPAGYSGFFLVESTYLDSKVNNERNDFAIFPVRTDMFSPLSWEIINEALKGAIVEIVKERIPKTQQLNKKKLTELYEERPYLVNYLEESDIDIAGFLDKTQLIEKAKRRFDVAKEKVLVNSGKEKFTDEELQEAIELAQNELVSYINDRVQVIERLKHLIDKKERVEKIIHNLFMEKQRSGDYFSVGKNNLWLLDDRFTTFSYAASDKRIRDVLGEMDIEIGDTKVPEDKPDLSIFFSHNPNNQERLKSVLVEIKPFDYSSKPDRKKFAGIQQLVDYVEAFKSKEKIDEIFAFLITDVDNKLADRLERDDYKPLFSLKNPIYFRYYQKTGISIFVVSATTLVEDAEARNKVFLDIIRKQSKIKKALS